MKHVDPRRAGLGFAAPPPERSLAYQKLFKIVDGAVVDAFRNHPDYLTPKGRKSARFSVVKRVTGTVLGFADQAKGRNAAATEQARRTLVPAGESGSHVFPGVGGASSAPHCRIGKIRARPVSGRTRAHRRDIEARYRTHLDLMRELGRAM